MLQKCAHALISQQELSSQQVMSYLLDYDDHFMSHSFKSLYWTAFENYVNKQIPSPGPECYTIPNLQQQPIQSDSNLQSVQNDTPNQNEMSNDCDSDDEIKISVVDNKLVIDASQQADYVFRNSLLDEMCLWDFCAQTEKFRSESNISKIRSTSYNHSMLSSTDHTRPTFSFMNEHDQYSTHVLQIKHPSQRCIPTLFGTPPRIDCEEQHEKYSHFILILFKPCKLGTDLRQQNQS